MKSLFAGALAVSIGAPAAQAGEGPFAFIYKLDLQPQDTWQFQQWEWLQTGQSQGDYNFLTNRSELFKLGSDIKNISGATLSSKHITDGVKRVLAMYELALKGK